MDADKANALADKLNHRLKSLGATRSYAKAKFLKSGKHTVRLVIHPSEKDIVPSTPPGVTTEPWSKGIDSSSPYVKITPYTPLPKTDEHGFYPSTARRQTGPTGTPGDTNPATPNVRHDLQDLVRVSSMNHALKTRVAAALNRAEAIFRLRRIALAGNGYDKESEYMVSELLDQLSKDGYTGRHKIVQLVKKLKTAMKADGYAFAGG